jgi:hypothetical protein
MFICHECLKKNYEEVMTLRGSYGPCEDCGKTRNCADIPSSALTPKKTKS